MRSGLTEMEAPDRNPMATVERGRPGAMRRDSPAGPMVAASDRGDPNGSTAPWRAGPAESDRVVCKLRRAQHADYVPSLLSPPAAMQFPFVSMSRRPPARIR